MTSKTSSWERARAVADAVLYEGYLLYPYRGTSSKNQSRWQFGVLGPPGAAAAGLGEDDSSGRTAPVWQPLASIVGSFQSSIGTRGSFLKYSRRS